MLFLQKEEAEYISNKNLQQIYNMYLNIKDKNQFLKFQIHRPYQFIKPLLIWKKFGFYSVGKTIFQDNIIMLNENYLSSPDANNLIKPTIIHEFSHMLNYYYYGNQHDKQWEYIDKLFGDDGQIYHHLRFPTELTKNKHILYCQCREFLVNNKTYKNYKNYYCKKCNKSLTKRKIKK